MEEERYQAPAVETRRFEKVKLDGGSVVVRELTVRELMVLVDKCSMPPQLGGGINPNEEITWKVILSCYESDAPDAAPIWQPTPQGLAALFKLRIAEFDLLAGAVNRVNGRDREAVEQLMDFTAVREAASASP